jgi:hypothetical protein
VDPFFATIKGLKRKMRWNQLKEKMRPEPWTIWKVRVGEPDLAGGRLEEKRVKTPLLELGELDLKIGKHGLKLGYKIEVLIPPLSSCISSLFSLHLL